MQSDGQSAADGDDADRHLRPGGDVLLEVQSTRRRGHVHLDGHDRRRPPPVPAAPGRATNPDRRSWRATSPATATSTWPSPTTAPTRVSVLLGNGDGTFQPQVTYAVGSRPDRHRGGRLHRRRPDSTWPSPTRATTTVSVLLGNGDGTFQPQVTYAVGSGPDAIVAGDFTGDGRTRPGRRQLRRQRRVGAAGQRRRHLPAPGHLRGGVGPVRHRGGRLHRRRPDSTWPSPTPARQRRVGAAGQRRRHLPAPGDLRGGVRTRSPSWRATSTATAGPTWPSPTQAPTTCRCCWATATAPSSPRSPTRWGPTQTPSWRATSTATAAPTWPSPTAATTTCRCCWATATAPSSPR